MGKKLGHPVKLLDIGGGLPGLDDEEMNFKKVGDLFTKNKRLEKVDNLSF